MRLSWKSTPQVTTLQHIYIDCAFIVENSIESKQLVHYSQAVVHAFMLFALVILNTVLIKFYAVKGLIQNAGFFCSILHFKVSFLTAKQLEEDKK